MLALVGLEEALYLGDKIAVMQAGKIEQVGTPAPAPHPPFQVQHANPRDVHGRSSNSLFS